MALAKSIAKTFVTVGMSIDDLIGEAYLSLANAVATRNDDPQYITNEITTALQAFVAENINDDVSLYDTEIGYDPYDDWKSVALNAAIETLPERTQFIINNRICETPTTYTALGEIVGVSGSRTKSILDTGVRRIIRELERTRVIPERNDNFRLSFKAALAGKKSILEQKLAYFTAPYSNYNAQARKGSERYHPLEIIPYVKNEMLGTIPEPKPEPEKVEKTPEDVQKLKDKIKKDTDQFFGMMALEVCGMDLQFTKSPTERMQLAAIKQNGMAIEFVENPSKEMQRAAVMQNGMAIAFIDNPSNELLHIAMGQFAKRTPAAVR